VSGVYLGTGMLLDMPQLLCDAAAHSVTAGTLHPAIAEVRFARFFVSLRILSVAVVMPVTKTFWGFLW
jgi:hypothetical protein